MIYRFKQFVKRMTQQIYALYIASADKRTPLAAKCLIFIVVSYALSPIDLIPDFIPILGYIDDLLLLPIGIYFAIKLIPHKLWSGFLEQARQHPMRLPPSFVAAIAIIMIWLAVIALLIHTLW